MFGWELPSLKERLTTLDAAVQAMRPDIEPKELEVLQFRGRPVAMAWVTVPCPKAASPQAKTPSRLVAPVKRTSTPRAPGGLVPAARRRAHVE